MQTRSEQRSSARAAVTIDVRLARKAGRALAARTVNLGEGGACVRCDRPLHIDEELHFDLDLPAGGCHLDGTARVLRQRGHNEYALRFEDLAHQAELRAFLASATPPSPMH